MLTLPSEFSKQISVFAPLFSKKVFEHAKVLLLGSILSLGRRTVCGALRSAGLQDEKRFHKYHRVLNLAKWSCHQGARILLSVLIRNFSQDKAPLVFGIDETIERRWGTKIKARGIYRDSVNSSHNHFVKCSGLRWMCLMFLTPISWADRVWALPFLSVLAPSKRYYESIGKTPKKLTDWARQMILQLARWLPHRQIIVVGDSAYTCYNLLDAVKSKVCMITPLRLDARLFDPPSINPPGKRGPKPRIGARQLTLAQRLTHPQNQWRKIEIPKWYGHTKKSMLVSTGIAVWYKSSFPHILMRWVLIKDPAGILQPKALQCTDLNLSAEQVINFFIRRWTVEVTFEEVRAHLGVETQRQWSDLAVARTTPILLGLFSLVTLWADGLQKRQKLSLTTFAWYQKSHPTFSDAIASVRYRIWRKQNFLTSLFREDVHNLKATLFKHLIFCATRAA